MSTILVVLAGGCGGLARYWFGGAVQRRTGRSWPIGTAAVNLLGAAGAGLLLGLDVGGAASGAIPRVVGLGFLGGFTTFSTWMVESLWLAASPRPHPELAAAANLVGMVLAGVVAVAAGSSLAV